MVSSLYETAKKAALAHKNKEVNQLNCQVLAPGGQLENQNAAKDASKTNNYINKKDVIIRFDDNQGNSKSYALRRLERARPDLHAQCLAGEMTPHAAMVTAGFRKKPPSRKRTPLERLYMLWDQVSPDDRLKFLIEMLTPAERRAIQCGIEEENGC